MSGSTRGDDYVAGSEDDAEGFDLAKKYETLYAQWLTMVQENSVLANEKVKLEAQIGEALKHASEKEEEARQARVQLEETQKGLRMLNTGTDQLDHLLSIGHSDRCGLGFKGESSKGGCVFVSAGVTENVATYATKPAVKSSRGSVTDGKAATDDVKVATAIATAAKAANVTVPRTGEATAARAATTTAARGATATRKTLEVQSAPRRAFVPFCHHCGVRGHIRPRCFKLLREKHQMKQTYGMRFHNLVCYCEAEGHVQRGGLKSGHGANHGGIRLMDTWSGRSGN